MSSFIKRIKTEQGSLNFYFNPLISATYIRYLVSVVAKDRKTYMFQMQEESGTWVIVEQHQVCPRWITALEKDYSNAIGKQLHLEYVSA